jgi:hypothetical protein
MFSCLVLCVVLCCVVLSCLVLRCVLFCSVVLCCLVLCCLVLSCVVLSCVVLCCLVLCCLVLCCLVLCCVVLSYLSCVVLSCVVFSCVLLSCLVLSSLVIISLFTHSCTWLSPCLCLVFWLSVTFSYFGDFVLSNETNDHVGGVLLSSFDVCTFICAFYRTRTLNLILNLILLQAPYIPSCKERFGFLIETGTGKEFDDVLAANCISISDIWAWDHKIEKTWLNGDIRFNEPIDAHEAYKAFLNGSCRILFILQLIT